VNASSPLRPKTRHATRAVLGIALVLGAVVAPSPMRAGSSDRASAKLDPRLVSALTEPSGSRLDVWVSFLDHGERDAADRAAMLARAEAQLAPRNRARRLKARVSPLVDERDLPVSPAYLQALGERGLAPHAVSRWFNRATVVVPADRLLEIADIAFVARLAPVERVWRSLDPQGVPPEAWGAQPAPARGRAPAATAIDYGRMRAVLAQIGVPAVHDSGYTGAGVLVCILDAGFNFHERHEALRDVIIRPGRTRDFVDGDTTVTDEGDSGLDHGALVMGCIAGNKPGVYVGSGFGAEFALARTEADAFESRVEEVYWEQGAEWADSLGADLITSSLGYFTFDPGQGDYAYADMDGHTTIISRAAEIAASKGILVVNAVGNEGNKSWHYLIAPADVNGDSLIAVGAVNGSGLPASFSSFGPSADGRIKPDLAAGGVSIPVVGTDSIVGIPYDPTAYGENSGTSLAAPILAGLAACLLQARPSWTPQQVILALRETASQFAHPDFRVGYGIANGAQALRWPIPPPDFVPRGSVDIALRGPNPFGAGTELTTVIFAVASGSSSARVRVYDCLGRRVRQLWSGTLTAGSPQAADWDGRDDDGDAARPGLYWIGVEVGENRAATRVVLLR